MMKRSEASSNLTPAPKKLQKAQTYTAEKKIIFIAYCRDLLDEGDWRVADLRRKIRDKFNIELDWHTVNSYKRQAMRLIGMEEFNREEYRRYQLNALHKSIAEIELLIAEQKTKQLVNINAITGLLNTKKAYTDLAAHITGLKTDVQVSVSQPEQLVIYRSQPSTSPNNHFATQPTDTVIDQQE